MHGENRSRGVSVCTDESEIATENAIASATEIATTKIARENARKPKRKQKRKLKIVHRLTGTCEPRRAR